MKETEKDRRDGLSLHFSIDVELVFFEGVDLKGKKVRIDTFLVKSLQEERSCSLAKWFSDRTLYSFSRIEDRFDVSRKSVTRPFRKRPIVHYVHFVFDDFRQRSLNSAHVV